MTCTLVPSKNLHQSRPARIGRLLLASLCFLATLHGFPAGSPSASAAGWPQTDRPLFAPDQILVQFRATESRDSRARAARDEGATLEREIAPGGLVKLRLGHGDTVERALQRWGRRADVEYAVPNLRARACFVPNDTLITNSDFAWNLRSLHAYDAWDIQTGDPRVVVAIIDTGVAHQDHAIPDYERVNLWPGTTKYLRSPDLPGPFLPGWDFIHDDPDADDDAGHGTTVATLVAGAANNIAGSAGVAFGVTIMPIKVIDFQNDSDMSFIVSGIRFAADHGANVANLSLGFPPLDTFRYLGYTERAIREFFRPLREAVSYAQRRGVILVAASGNFADSDFSFNAEVSLPAALPGVIAVGATGISGHRASYSSYGSDLDFMAPGGDFLDENGDGVQDQLWVLSIKPHRSEGSLAKPDSFACFNFIGTSGAAPQATGAVALLLSKGYTSQGAIEQTLRETSVRPAGAARQLNFEYGAGLIQLDAALRARMPQATQAASTAGSSIAARLLSSNPARGGASLGYRVARPGRVRVRLFDVRGALVRTLEDREVPAGQRQVRWDGRSDSGADAAAGIYLFRIETPDGADRRKFAFLR